MPIYDNIEYNVTDGVAELHFDRPHKMNAINQTTHEELLDALQSFRDDTAAYVLLLSGKGDAFCSGMDLSEDQRVMNKGGFDDEIYKILYLNEKPTIAAVNGPAIALGCSLALMCDFRIMSKSSYLREGHVDIGLAVGKGGGWMLPRLVGESKAKEYAILGRDIKPTDALSSGIAVKVVEDERILQAGRRITKELRDKPATSIRNSKRILGSYSTFEEFLAKTPPLTSECTNDPEHEEAVQAFLENRSPNYDRSY